MRVTTGIKKLDSLISGGFPENSVILLSGGPGSGKTLFALNFLLEGARKGEKSCFITLCESREELIKAATAIKSLEDIKKYEGKNLIIENMRFDQSNVSMNRFVDIVTNYPKIDRIVIDDVNKLLMFSENTKTYRAYLIELVQSLKKSRASLLICETKHDNILDSGGDESFECDGVVQLMFLDIEEKPMRSLIVHKMRYTNFDAKVPHELIINKNELKLTETKII